MNVFEIECLARAAAELLGTMSSSEKPYLVGNKILDRIDSELAGVETSEEISSLQHSNNIKQANLNKLAGMAVKVADGYIAAGQVNRFDLDEMKALAEALIQPEPVAETAVN